MSALLQLTSKILIFFFVKMKTPSVVMATQPQKVDYRELFVSVSPEYHGRRRQK